MLFNPGEFDRILSAPTGLGQNMRWRKATACPCVNPRSGAATPGCLHCFGNGTIWAKPIDVIAGVASQKVVKQWAQFGQYEAGDAVVSIPQNSPMFEAGQFDRVMMVNATDRFSLVLTRGTPGERLKSPVTSITRVFWYSGSNTIEGAAPSVDANGGLTWPNGSPPSGVQYSISGTRMSEYYVYGNYPSDRPESFGMRLPKNMVLRKFDLFGRSGQN